MMLALAWAVFYSPGPVAYSATLAAAVLDRVGTTAPAIDTADIEGPGCLRGVERGSVNISARPS